MGRLPVGREDIEAAAARIKGYIRRTPVLTLEAGELAGHVSLKLDFLQPTGSFKPRGAFSLLVGSPPSPDGVVAASGGNFGLAVVYAADRLGLKATIFVPASSPPAKIARLQSFPSAAIEVIPGVYDDALAASREWLASHDAFFAHAYDQPEVVAGQGTCALEIDAQLPGIDTVVVAVGGGGLIGGVAAWFEDRVKVVAVETEQTPTLNRALAAGRPVDVEIGGIAVSSLGSRRVGEIAFAVASRYVDGSILVSDDDIVAAQRWLWETARIAAEPGAAAPTAALLTGAYRPEPSERVALIVCGANLDPASIG
jgi:threonine dehydratase